MRPALFVAAGAALAQASSAETAHTVVECQPWAPINSSLPTNTSIWPTSPNATATDATPSETSGESAIPTAGAISQPLQSSVVGLLGFLIVGLILV